MYVSRSMPNIPPKKCSNESALIKIATRFFADRGRVGWNGVSLTSTMPGAAIGDRQPRSSSITAITARNRAQKGQYSMSGREHYKREAGGQQRTAKPTGGNAHREKLLSA